MCGIFGYVGGKKNAGSIVLDGLKRLEYRGYDSWGIAVSDSSSTDNKIIIKKRTGKIGDAKTEDLPLSDIGFGHTRWATHGQVTEENAHPHLDCTEKLALIHNGIIENYQELKKWLLKKGHIFRSDTDTEVAVHLIEEYAKKMIVSKAVQKAFMQMEGLNAFIVFSLKEHKFVAVRNGSPLVVGYGQHNENYLASDASALIPYTRQVHFLEDNELAIVSERGIMIFNALTGEEIHPIKQTLDWSVEQTVRGKYPHFMIKEIYDQPGILSDIAANYQSQIEKMAEIIKKSYGTYMVGCGTASYACLAGTYIFSEIAKRHINWAIGSEFSYHLDFLTPKSLVFALSQSGETMDTLESVKRAQEKGATVFALVNVLGSSLYRNADYKMLIGAGPEISVASTKAMTAKIAILIYLAYAVAGKTQEGQEILINTIKSLKKLLNPVSRKQINNLALEIAHHRHIYVVGRGLSYPVSLETALKIKEISYIHAEGIAAGELKHGPLALVEKGTPCIVFLPKDETYPATISGAMEMKARGGYIIGASYKNHEIFDSYININDAAIGTIIPNIVFGQLLAYELTLIKNLDPDKPRNLAKSVTVK